jgi:hypothetical protein
MDAALAVLRLCAWMQGTNLLRSRAAVAVTAQRRSVRTAPITARAGSPIAFTCFEQDNVAAKVIVMP